MKSFAITAQGLLVVVFLSLAHGFLLPTGRDATRPMFRCGLQLRTASSSEETPGNIQTEPRPSPDMAAYASAYKTVFEELPFQVCRPSFGKIPSDLKGTYYRAGPAMFSAGSIVPPKTSIVQPKQPPVPDGRDPSRMVLHPFEGDGAVLGVTFSDCEQDDENSVIARYRFVRTVAFTNERKKGAKIYNGMESTRAMGPAAANGLGNDFPIPLFMHHLQPGFNKQRKNTSNLRTIYWGKRLLSLWEGGQPYKLDAKALQTEGRSQLGGALPKETSPFGGKMVVSGDRALFYGIEQDLLGKSKLALYEFDDAFRLVDRQSVDLPGFALITDFAATANYAVFITPPVVTKANLLLGSKEPGKALVLDPDEQAYVTLVPRVGSNKSLLRLPLPKDQSSDAGVHFINAYEDGTNVVVDCVRSDVSKPRSTRPMAWPWGETLTSYQESASRKSLWRYKIDVASGAVTKIQLLDTHGYFGIVNPAYSSRRHRYVYMTVGGRGSEAAPPQGIAKVDVDSPQVSVDLWMPQDYEFCGEPMYAARTGSDALEEDSGYVLSVLYDGRREESDLIVFDARNISSGPITRIPLGIAIPHGHFGCFAGGAEARWSAEELERRAKLFDKVESRGNQWNELKSDFSGLGLRFDDMEEYFGDFFS